MPVCAVIGCRNRTSPKSKCKKKALTFHMLPRNGKLKRQWLTAISGKKWASSKYTYVCSEHFSKDLFDRSSQYRVRLIENAVPNIIEPCSLYQQKEGKTRATKCNISVALNGSEYVNRKLRERMPATNSVKKKLRKRVFPTKSAKNVKLTKSDDRNNHEESNCNYVIKDILEIIKVEPLSEDECKENAYECISQDSIANLKVESFSITEDSYKDSVQMEDEVQSHLDRVSIEPSSSTEDSSCKNYVPNHQVIVKIEPCLHTEGYAQIEDEDLTNLNILKHAHFTYTKDSLKDSVQIEDEAVNSVDVLKDDHSSDTKNSHRDSFQIEDVALNDLDVVNDDHASNTKDSHRNSVQKENKIQNHSDTQKIVNSINIKDSLSDPVQMADEILNHLDNLKLEHCNVTKDSHRFSVKMEDKARSTLKVLLQKEKELSSGGSLSVTKRPIDLSNLKCIRSVQNETTSEQLNTSSKEHFASSSYNSKDILTDFIDKEENKKSDSMNISKAQDSSNDHILSEFSTLCKTGENSPSETVMEMCNLRKENEKLKDVLKQSNLRIHELEMQLSQYESMKSRMHKEIRMPVDLFSTFLNDDQIEFLRKNRPKRNKWCNQTLKNALKLRIACGELGYKQLLKQKYPMPPTRSLVEKLQDINFDGFDINETLSMKIKALNKMKKQGILLIDKLQDGNMNDS